MGVAFRPVGGKAAGDEQRGLDLVLVQRRQHRLVAGLRAQARGSGQVRTVVEAEGDRLGVQLRGQGETGRRDRAA